MTRQHLAGVASICIAFLVIAGFFLITEHRAHGFGVLPYLLLLACPLIHLLSHGRHGGHHGGQGGQEQSGGHHHGPSRESEGGR